MLHFIALSIFPFLVPFISSSFSPTLIRAESSFGQTQNITVWRDSFYSVYPYWNLTEATITKDLVNRKLFSSPFFIAIMLKEYENLDSGRCPLDDRRPLVLLNNNGAIEYNIYQWLKRRLDSFSFDSIGAPSHLVKMFFVRGLHRTAKVHQLIRQSMHEWLAQKDIAKCKKRLKAIGDDCAPFWDGYRCWPTARAGERVTITCPIYDGFYIGQTSTIMCSKEGKYPDVGDYSRCTEKPAF